jgi:hypothetical protein
MRVFCMHSCLSVCMYVQDRSSIAGTHDYVALEFSTRKDAREYVCMRVCMYVMIV